jgi:hypothetical protein
LELLQRSGVEFDARYVFDPPPLPGLMLSLPGSPVVCTTG